MSVSITVGEADTFGRRKVTAFNGDGDYVDYFNADDGERRFRFAERVVDQFGLEEDDVGDIEYDVRVAVHDADNAASNDTVVEKAVEAWNGWDAWVASLSEKNRQNFYRVAADGNQLNRIRIAKGRMTAIGGREGLGKTTLAMQLLFNMLDNYPDAVLVVANVEMDPDEILERNLARIADVPYSAIRDRCCTKGQQQMILDAAAEIVDMRDRLHFMKPPFEMGRLRHFADEKNADAVCLDYLQRFRVAGVTDFRVQVTDVMNEARAMAMEGKSVVLLSALSRGGEFRESSEVEYSVDYAYKMEVPEGGPPDQVLCRCVKSRNAAKEDVELTANLSLMQFLAPDEPTLEPEQFDEFASYSGGIEY